MYLPVPSQPDCVSAWLEAVRLVNARPGHHDHNVVIDVANPLARASRSDPVVAEVDAFFENRDTKRIETVANTIFPAALYRRYGSPAFFDRFRDKVLPKVRSQGKKSWSGYYFERMMQLPQFEAGREDVGKKGVVRDAAVHERVCGEVRDWLTGEGWHVLDLVESPITGPEGNVEFLIAAMRRSA